MGSLARQSNKEADGLYRPRRERANSYILLWRCKNRFGVYISKKTVITVVKYIFGGNVL